MTSQAERIKAFKLAQHARLQKQDDEEQWISSEELCTEGSSDEETHTSATGHRRLKRNNKPQKRGISPLAQPSKKDESSSSDLNDSNYLLPEIPISRSIFETNQSKENKSFDENKSKDLSETNSEESLDASEIEAMIQWRPKRGSIKLPEFPEGIPAVEVTSADNFNQTEPHSLFEMNAFFTEMNLTIRNLKLKRTKYESVLFPDIDENEEMHIGSSMKFKNRFDISTLLDDVNELDDLISEKSFILEKAIEERKVVQHEMCSMILTDFDSNSLMSKSMQTFLELCNFELNSNTDKDSVETSENDAGQKITSEKPEIARKNFINRNIQLAKQYSMAQCSLTDEEKIQLESLLSDNSDTEDCLMGTNIHTESIKTKKEKDIVKRTKTRNKDDKPKCNYFKLNDDEASVMKNLDIQLHEILQSYKEENVDVHESFNTPNEDVLEVADQEGKYWKHEQIRMRLEKIQKNLNQMVVKDEEDQKKLKEIYEHSDNDSDN